MSYKESQRRVENGYQAALLVGTVTPASLLVGSLNFVLLISWLMISPSISDSVYKRSRWLVFGCIVYASTWSLLYNRSMGVIGGIGVGLNSVMCIIIAANLMLLHDTRTFKRAVLQLSSKGNAAQESDGKIRRTSADREHGELQVTWETVPKFGIRRLFWILDLIGGLRGVHWAWKPTPLPKFLSSSQKSLGGLTALFSNNIFRFSIDYLAFDIIKCSMIADPYFLGYSMSSSPPHLAAYISSPLALYLYRMLLAVAGGFIAIDMIYTFGMALQVNLLGPRILGLNAHQSTFPPLWGSYRSILNNGLRGFWSKTWHQMLRMHLASVGHACADFLLRDKQSVVATHLRTQTSNLRRRIVVCTVFFLSGILHAAAAYTLLGPTRPWEFLLFFMLQPLGIAIQDAFARYAAQLYPPALSRRGRQAMQRAANLSFTLLWLAMCSPLMLDGFTSGGLWMLEPVPVSFVRGLGLGVEGERRFWNW